MAITPPKLDDRTFEQLMDAARERAANVCEEWTDWSPGNPAVALTELFAYLTETMIYRLNRLPDKAYVEFLRLMGLQLQPPSAASVTLEFSRIAQTPEAETSGERPQLDEIEIPAGTQVVPRDADEGTVPFVTTQPARILSDQNSVAVQALHFHAVEGERLKDGTGEPAQTLQLKQAPVIAPTGDPLDMEIGVETQLDDLHTARRREYGGKVFRIWTLVEHFTQQTDDRFVYTADRNDGTIQFAPAIRSLTATEQELSTASRDSESVQAGVQSAPRQAGPRLDVRPQALAEIPPRNAEIRAWYRTGGGAAGNVAKHVLTRIVIPAPTALSQGDGDATGERPVALDELVTVTNPEPATGGSDAETLNNALIRGPQQLHARDRAVTARDFERIAVNMGSVARAKAVAQAELWKHATPGTVEVLLVPDVPVSERRGGRVTLQQLRNRQTRDAYARIETKLNECRPLGSDVNLRWADYCEVRVSARVKCFRGEDTTRIRSEVEERLNEFISPLDTQAMRGGWAFDQQLPAGRLYDEIFRVPGVREIDRLRLIVDDIPDNDIQSLAADHFQPRTWHVISGFRYFRSLDNGLTWQPRTPDETAEASERLSLVRTDCGQPGRVAVVATNGEGSGSSSVYYSTNCGQTWKLAVRTGGYVVHDAAWVTRDNSNYLLLATSSGLYQFCIETSCEAELLKMAGMPEKQGFWTVSVSPGAQGQTDKVAVAAKSEGGVFVSYEGGQPMTFLPIGQRGRDVRTLCFQQFSSRELLWAGTRVVGSRAGEGCSFWEGIGQQWTPVIRDWPGDGGSCLQLACSGPQLYAATYGGGIVWLDAEKMQSPAWRSAGSRCGLPTASDSHRFLLVSAVGAGTDGHVIAGGAEGMFQSADRGQSWQDVCQRERIDSVPLGRQVLFTSGIHELDVTIED